MLYKFKSKATGDLIMLEPQGRHILTLVGKAENDSLGKGILLPQEMPAAIEALEAAVAREEAVRRQREEAAALSGEPAPVRMDAITLRQRTAPFITMLKRCLQEDKEIVWGV